MGPVQWYQNPPIFEFCPIADLFLQNATNRSDFYRHFRKGAYILGYTAMQHHICWVLSFSHFGTNKRGFALEPSAGGCARWRQYMKRTPRAVLYVVPKQNKYCQWLWWSAKYMVWFQPGVKLDWVALLMTDPPPTSSTLYQKRNLISSYGLGVKVWRFWGKQLFNQSINESVCRTATATARYVN